MVAPSKDPAFLSQKGEFARISPDLIKIEAGALWREEGDSDIASLKASIAWREQRMKGSGLLLPLLVSRIEGVDFYRLEDGLRRFKAIQALKTEGLPIESVPVRILPAPLSMSERVMLMTQGAKPLGILEQSRLITRLEKKGLTWEAMASLLGQPASLLARRALVTQITGPLAQALKLGLIDPQKLEDLLTPDQPLPAQVKRLEAHFHDVLRVIPTPNHSRSSPPSARPVVQALGGQRDSGQPWMPKILSSTMHYVALEGLYEWMGGANAVKRGYSKKVVEIIELMLKYCGGKKSIGDVAKKLKDYQL